MKVHCPSCGSQVAAGNLNLDTGWGKCDSCDDLFPLDQVVSGFTAPALASAPPAERPFNARAVVERGLGEFSVVVPAEGLRAATAGMLGFAAFWLTFIAFWTAGALGIFAGEKPQTFNLMFAAFSIPFWLIGFGMLIGVAWSVWGTKSIVIDRNAMNMHKRCLIWSRTRIVDCEAVQHAQKYKPKVQSEGQTTLGVEVVYRAGSFVLPSDTEQETNWLIAEINDFLKSVRR